MYCINCGARLSKRDYCSHCGYMNNGVFIDTINKEVEVTPSEMYFGDKYDMYLRNKNFKTPLVFGPIYILCNNNFIIGLILTALDIAIILALFILSHAIILYYPMLLVCFVIFALNRFLWATTANMIYLKLTKLKLNIYMLFKPKNYQVKLNKYYKFSHFLIGFRYIIFFALFLLLFVYLKTTIYDYLHLA